MNFLKNTYKNIPGITIIDSGKNGENIGIFAVTHGNEPVGIQIFDFLINDFQIQKKIKSGKIFLIAVNILAYEKYLETGDINNFRFLDDNMNRISIQEFKNGSYEFSRFSELKIIFSEIDIAIDIHSVPKGNDVFGLSDKKYLKEAIDFFDLENILIDEMGKTGTLIGEISRQNKKGFGIECGNHIDEIGFENGKRNILNFLKYYKAIDGEIEKVFNDSNIFEFLEEIIPKTDNFSYLKDFSGFTKIENSETFAEDGNIELKNNFGENIFLGIPHKIFNKGDGAGFLFRKVLNLNLNFIKI